MKALWNGFSIHQIKTSKFLLKIMTRPVTFYTHLILRGTVQIIAIHISSTLVGPAFSLRFMYVCFTLFTQDGFKEERNISPGIDSGSVAPEDYTVWETLFKKKNTSLKIHC